MYRLLFAFTILMVFYTAIYAADNAKNLPNLADVSATRDTMDISVKNITCYDGIAQMLLCNAGISDEPGNRDDFLIFGFTAQDPLPSSEPEVPTSTPMFIRHETKAATSTPPKLDKPPVNIPFELVGEKSLTTHGCKEITLRNMKDNQIFQCGDTVLLHGGSSNSDIVIDFVLPK